MKGAKDIARKIEAGEDPNADLAAGPAPGSQAEAALGLKIAGASWTTIAKTLDLSGPWEARRMVEMVLAAAAASPEKIDQQRHLHSRRLERLLSSVMPAATNPRHSDHLAYNARALAILDRIAALGGLNAPAQAVVYTPKAEEIEKYVAKFAVLAQADTEAAEADVIDADIEEG